MPEERFSHVIANFSNIIEVLQRDFAVIFYVYFGMWCSSIISLCLLKMRSNIIIYNVISKKNNYYY